MIEEERGFTQRLVELGGRRVDTKKVGGGGESRRGTQVIKDKN